MPAKLLSKIHPMAKGMMTYALLWPTGSLIQQTIEGRNFKTYDWARALRFSLFGSLYVAPTLYGWVRLTSAMWPQTNLRIGLLKAATEQLSYGPFACVSFFMGMSLLELKTFQQAVAETKEKALPTYKVGVCCWPIIQTINFSLVPEHNRVIFVSFCSLLWTIFLAYMKTQAMEPEHEQVQDREQGKHPQPKEIELLI
ncbi:PREDICTED: mpv17-like protein isoform X1 [Drosophila arizonae]|uniref:Mpv17-like protein isoform X1 n=1 Tax=Drosophila arizonae TaxID=7263 RepID=A0ABM1PXT8_DROAR|nr:PREDICTED: mpv17-like protein isoform X1 [Drosophila arizonae]XP_017872025.1 PREDICTED: mpv17-like protein isoform X1 [Drosophila arizonae]